MCFMCSSVLCCASLRKSTSKSKINGSGNSVDGGDCKEEKGAWYRTQKQQVVLKQLRSLKHLRPLPPTPKSKPNSMAEVPDKVVQKKIDKLLDENLYEDVKNANLAPEEGRRAPTGTPQDLLEEWVRGLRMDCEANGEDDEDSTSFSDMSTQTEWTTGWEPAPEQNKPEKSSKRSSVDVMDNIYDIPQTRLTKEEVQILESRLNWLGSQIHGRRAQYQGVLGDRRSVTMPNSRTSSKRSTVRSMTARSDDIALAEFRRELAKVAIMNREREERLRRKQKQRQSYLEEEEKILNDLDAPHGPSSDSTSDNNPSFREEELDETGAMAAEERPSRGAQIPEPSSKRSSGTCSCSNSSCSCSCCSDAWWLNQNEPASGTTRDTPSKGALSTVEETEGDAQVPRGKRPEPEGEEMKMDESSTSSISSGYMEEWREEGRRKTRAMTMTSTTTSSSAGGATTGWSSYKPESDEWVFVVSSSLSSAPEPEIWLAKEGVGVVRGKIETIAEEDPKRGIKKEDSLGYGTLPPSESDLVLRKAEMIKQNEKNDEKNKNKSNKKDKDVEETVIIKADKKKRGIAYFRKKISKKDKEDKKKKKEEKTTDNDKIKEQQKMENPIEAPPSPAPQAAVAHPGKGKVAAEVARINENAKREVQNFIEPINLARLKNENRPRISSAIIRERTSSLGRNFGRRPPLGKYEPRVLPDRAAMTSPEVTPKRSARKQQMMRERAMQIEVERSQLTTDDEDEERMNLDPEESWMTKVRGQIRRRRRSRTFSGERRRVGSFAPQTPGIGQLLMVQAEFGQKSQLVRDNIHITAV